MARHFFAILSRSKYINRWPLMRNTRPETVCEHLYDAATLCHVLAELTNRRFGGDVDVGRCVLLALYHDVPEILTGDLPTPVKYHNAVMLDAYRQVEDAAAARLLSMLPPDLCPVYRPLLSGSGSDMERRLVKAADKLSALIKCVGELRLGNPDFTSARDSLVAILRAMELPAVDCFMDEFLPSYALTIDEQM